jgi:hypothetical protein
MQIVCLKRSGGKGIWNMHRVKIIEVLVDPASTNLMVELIR